MVFKPTQKLLVQRTLSTGKTVDVGVLAQNKSGVYFQYEVAYLAQYGNLSPFTMQANTSLQKAPQTPHRGLHGVFSDSLPDGWGLLLQDRIFRQHGILPSQVTAMDRLALVGNRGLGALSYSPLSDYGSIIDTSYDIFSLGQAAEELYETSISMADSDAEQQILAALSMVGSSGGARPKAQVFMPADNSTVCRILPQPKDEAWLVKFTSASLPLGHEEGICEAVYLKIAETAGCQPPEWKLLNVPVDAQKTGAIAWLAVKRFDYLPHAQLVGRYHLHSVCGLLDADFRAPTLDYWDLVKASRQLCRSAVVGKLQFRRAIFNLFAANQDDHSKNWAFIQMDDGAWQVSPFFDITYSPHPYNEHATAFGGYGHAPPLTVIQKIASSAGYSSWGEAQQVIQEVVEAIQSFSNIAKGYGVRSTTASAIMKTLQQRRTENKHLWQSSLV